MAWYLMKRYTWTAIYGHVSGSGVLNWSNTWSNDLLTMTRVPPKTRRAHWSSTESLLASIVSINLSASWYCHCGLCSGRSLWTCVTSSYDFSGAGRHVQLKKYVLTSQKPRKQAWLSFGISITGMTVLLAHSRKTLRAGTCRQHRARTTGRGNGAGVALGLSHDRKNVKRGVLKPLRFDAHGGHVSGLLPQLHIKNRSTQCR